MFLNNVLSAATQVGVLYTIVAAGFICDKTGLFSEETARKVVKLLLNLIVPCAIINSFMNIEMNDDTVKKFFISLGLGAATHIIAIIINTVTFRNKSDEDNPVYKYASIYGNLGFMALPLAQAVLGAEGVFYCANGYVMFNIFTYIHGTAVMRKEKDKINLRKLILNPGVISFLIGLPVFLFGIKLPYVFSEPLSMLAALNSPMGMLIFGTYLAKTDIKSMFTDKKIYLVALMKLIVLPLVCFGVYYLCGVRGVLLTAAIISASVPSANNTFMFATMYDRNTAIASKTVALVSFMSILTIPVMIALTQMTW